MAFDRDQMRTRAAELAARGVYVGTSSWKYQGWCNMLYDEARYIYRGKFAVSRFERNCLSEYADVFKTVCVDAAYYSFPTERYLASLVNAVPADFRFGFKVTDEITSRTFPKLARLGLRAGQKNNNFLNVDLFASAFLKPCDTIRPFVGILMFEFSKFRDKDYARGSDFLAELDRFLGALPQGWPYGIEMRNRSWLVPEYFECLRRHRVAHVFNSWEAMPSVSEQMLLPGSRTHPELVGARFLLKPGRRYEESLELFHPYDRIREVNEDARNAGRQLILEGERYEPRKKTYIYVNNRLEGNSLETLAAMALNHVAITPGPTA